MSCVTPVYAGLTFFEAFSSAVQPASSAVQVKQYFTHFPFRTLKVVEAGLASESVSALTKQEAGPVVDGGGTTTDGEPEGHKSDETALQLSVSPPSFFG